MSATGALVGVLGFLLAVLAQSPAVGWLDSGNLTASAWAMGVAHPPGELAWLPLARAAQLLPVGDIAWRAGLVSAAATGLCAAALTELTQRLAGRRAALFGLPAVMLLGGPGGVLQGGRVEVYMPLCALLAVALWGALADSPRGTATAALALGLAGGVHPLLGAAATPALVAAHGLRRPGLLIAFGLVGLLWMPWAPLRALADPAACWGVPDNGERLLRLLTARDFAQNFSEAAPLANAGAVLRGWASAGGPLLWVPALLAARALPRASVVAVVWAVGNACTIVPQAIVFDENPDLHGYLLAGLLPWVPLAGVGFAALAARISAAAVPLAVAIATLGQVSMGQVGSGRGDWGAHRYAVAMGAGLPPGAVLMATTNDASFVWRYLDRVELRRPDLLVVARPLLGHAHERVRLAGLEARGLPWSSALRTTPLPLLAGAAPACVEPIDDPLDPPAAAHGVVWCYGVPGDAAPTAVPSRVEAEAAYHGRVMMALWRERARRWGR